MSTVFTAKATSVNGFITGPGPSPGEALGRGGGVLFDWYFNGDTQSREFAGFRLSAASAEVFDAAAGRIGAVVADRTNYDHSGGWAAAGRTRQHRCSCCPTGPPRLARSARHSCPPASPTPSRPRARRRAAATSR